MPVPDPYWDRSDPNGAQPGPDVVQQSTKNVSWTRLKYKYLISRGVVGGGLLGVLWLNHHFLVF